MSAHSRIEHPQGYTVRDVSRMLHFSEGQVRSWVRSGLIEPERGGRGEYRLSFQDLALLRKAKGLLEAIPPRRLRRALGRLKQRLPVGRPLSAVQIQAKGDRVVVRENEAVWNPESGQSCFNFEPEAPTAHEVAPHNRSAIRRALRSPRALSAEEWYALGFDLEAAAPAEAREAYRRALEVDPDHVDARVNLGRLYHEAGELEAGEAQYRMALNTERRNATAWFNLGVCLEDLGRPDEATGAYRGAIEADPEYADAYFNLAGLLEKAGDTRAALRYLKTYRELDQEC